MPSKKADSTRKDTDASAEPFRDDCPFCTKNADTMTAEGAQRRGRHYLALAEHEGVEVLKRHLTLYMHRWYPEDPDKANEVITGTMAWVWDEIRLYSDMADPETGAPLTWAVGTAWLPAGDAGEPGGARKGAAQNAFWNSYPQCWAMMHLTLLVYA